MDESRKPPSPCPGPNLPGDVPLLPARMINQYQYCPRLAYLEWIQGEWAESSDTIEGRYKHWAVDRPDDKLPLPEAMKAHEIFNSKSITLSSARLGLIAKMDLIESEGHEATPVDYKRGKRPHVAMGAYEPDRVQLCAQGMILEEHGYTCNEGVLYFAGSKERVRVYFDDGLRDLTLKAVNGLRSIAINGQIPEPLQDSPKCPRCSLVGICLPDEVNFLRRVSLQPRPLAVASDEALPVYVQSQHAKIAKNGEILEISIDNQNIHSVRLGEISQLVLMGNVYITTPCLHELMRREITVSWYSFGGWFFGHTVGTGHRNVELRTAQYRASFDESMCLRVAKSVVQAKILNCRTLLRRNWRGENKPLALLDALKHDVNSIEGATNLAELLGIEGSAASRYFGAFASMLKTVQDAELNFDFTRRNRRPPTDPVNALLSYAYALLVRTWTVTLSAVGFDPYRGYYHQPRYGRPALALDMMEPFRPLIADSVVIQSINNGEIRPTDFVRAAGSVNLTEEGRKRFIGTFERRMGQEITHPIFGYKLSYRRLLELEARLLGRYLLNEIPVYPAFRTR